MGVTEDPAPTPPPRRDDLPPLPQVSDELLEVRRRRFQEARRAGLTFAEAELFASGHCDVGELRRLRAKGCPAPLIARIVI